MQFIKPDVVTICYGIAMSMGATLLVGGAAGKRYALPNSRIMIHQGSGGFRGNTPDVEIQMREMMHLTTRIIQILADHTGQELEKVSRDTDRDYFMTTQEALEYGIIDNVITNRDGVRG